MTEQDSKTRHEDETGHDDKIGHDDKVGNGVKIGHMSRQDTIVRQDTMTRLDTMAVHQSTMTRPQRPRCIQAVIGISRCRFLRTNTVETVGWGADSSSKGLEYCKCNCKGQEMRL